MGYMIDPFILLILAVLLLVIALILYLTKGRDKPSSGGGKTAERPASGTSSDRPSSGTASGDYVPSGRTGSTRADNYSAGTGSGARPAKDLTKTASRAESHLYIPPEMLADLKKEENRPKISKDYSGIQWEKDEKSDFLYTQHLKKAGWVCPCCGGENSSDDEICMICGE